MVEHNKKHDKGNVGHRRGLNQFSDLTTEEFLHRNHGNIKTGLFLGREEIIFFFFAFFLKNSE